MLSGLDLSSTSHTNAGTYRDTWTFTDGTGNYNNAFGSVSDTINQAGSTTTVNCPTTPYTYNGSGQGCTATWTSTGTDAEHGSVTPISYSGTNGTTYQPPGQHQRDRPQRRPHLCNSMTSLSNQINSSGSGGTSTFNGKASIQDITNPVAPVSIAGNATLQVTMHDDGNPGSSDTIGITVWNKSGGMWFSSNFTGGKTIEQLLGGGNLVVQ